MAKELNDDDLLQVAGGFMSGLTYTQILQEIAAYLKAQGFNISGSSDAELEAFVTNNMTYDEVKAMKNYLWVNKDIGNNSLPMWLQSMSQFTKGLDTESLINSITGSN